METLDEERQEFADVEIRVRLLLSEDHLTAQVKIDPSLLLRGRTTSDIILYGLY